MRDPGRCFPSASLSLSSLRRTRWNSLDGRKKGLTSQIMPTEHGNAFRFEERLVGHLASLARSATVFSLLRCLSTDCFQRGALLAKLYSAKPYSAVQEYDKQMYFAKPGNCQTVPR